VLRLTGSGDIKVAVREVIARWPDLAGKVVIDIPAGKGGLGRQLLEAGAKVEAHDLFPEFFEADGIECVKADLSGTLPIPDEHADLVVCQEAIEHLPDQLHLFAELNRILKPGGTLLLTTPNVSNLRAKVSRLFVESELYNRQPPSELDAVWWSKDGERYYGHLFLVGVQQIRVLAKLNGFQIKRLLPVKASLSSLLLGVFFPLVLAFNLFAYWRTSVRDRRQNTAGHHLIRREILRLNLNRLVLFGKHLFLDFKKMEDSDKLTNEQSKSVDSIC